jgi:hypothetical protein
MLPQHRGDLPPAIDPAQPDLPARHEAEEQDQRSVFHCALGKAKNVSSSLPPSRRLVTALGQRLAHVRSKAV